MKLIISTILAITVLNVYGSTGDEKTIHYDGTINEHTLTLLGTKTHTEYRYEDVERTCYRQELIGYYRHCYDVRREQCTTTPRQCRTVCDSRDTDGRRGGSNCREVCTGGERRCTPYYEQVCESRPEYRTVPYTCYDRISVPYEVFDYNTIANVTIYTESPVETSNIRESIRVRLSGDQLKIVSVGQGNLIGLKTEEDVKPQFENGTMVINASYKINFIDASNVFAPFTYGITDIKLDKKSVSFVTGQVTNLSSLGISLTIKKRNLLLFWKKVVEQDLNYNQFSIEPYGEKTKVVIDLDKLNISKLKKGKYKLELSIYSKFNYEIISDQSHLPRQKVTSKFRTKI